MTQEFLIRPLTLFYKFGLFFHYLQGIEERKDLIKINPRGDRSYIMDPYT